MKDDRMLFIDPSTMSESRLRCMEGDLPTIGDDDVLIAVAAAGVNRADLLQRRGGYPPPPGISDVLGLEVSGKIAALGANVSDLVLGDDVCALLAGGGYAEYVAVSRSLVMQSPGGIGPIGAAGLPESVCTAWLNLVDLGGVGRGSVVLIHGGTSGVGSMGVQLARELGAFVVATAGSTTKVDKCLEFGAHMAINYKEADFPEEVLKAFPGGVDVILDMVGGSYVESNLACLATDGRLVAIGRMGGDTGMLDMRPLIRKRIAILGSSLRSLPNNRKSDLVRDVESNVWPMIERGKVSVCIDSVYPLCDAHLAHERLLSGEVVGKVILDISGR